MLSLTIALPLVGALVLAAMPATSDGPVRLVALIASLAAFVSSVVLLFQFDLGDPNLQLAESWTWIPMLDARIAFAVDGVSLLLILLTTLLTPLVLLASWSSVTDRLRGYAAAFLVLEAAVIGVFAATDLLLFYIFFEFTLVPMYLIIGIWGGAGRRYAAVKFFLYTLF
ncbi:MAG: proton-conducting transporter membrane subunit, partial [Actinomycetota bacterium]